MERLSGLLGIITILALAYVFSADRKAIRIKTVVWGLGLQFALALFVLRTTAGVSIFRWTGEEINRLLSFAHDGSTFVFGQLGTPGNTVAVFAFQVLPTIIFIAALFAILYYFGIMQIVVRAFAKVMTRLMGASGAESLNVAASIFLGQTEAPLTIRPFISAMTRSELMCIMTSGMAHVSGGIMAAYIAFGVEARHLLTAVIMTAPGTLLLAKMFVPETGKPRTAGDVHLKIERTDVNVIDAAARGTTEGLHLALNVAAMLIAFLALVALLNAILGIIPMGGGEHLSLQWIFGRVAAPLAWLMGVPWKDCFQVGNLLATRLVLNELIAYSQLGPLKASLDPRSFVIATFALCGFANLSSIGIQIGGIGALAPERRQDLARLGFRAVAAGTLANYLSASIAGILL
ncbi:MAG: NupC/NupG family nucleoside CNT transporter [Acidobacteria bacterium]|nr:MAG: NupC/NupG family nucleoside CNT transporter [Acidobacteriota bacterium]PYV04001.1 MAG: NupC/NupG family nucleoside CNT transporter [Acidobacteriota bacterium]PYV41379.1 MAG: NupC/NupG family nucleoside CNT transporter [Acidobacteriota bacterium]